MPNPVAVIELVDVLDQSVLQVEEASVSVVELKDEETLIVEETVIEVISEGFQGPQGPPGIPEEEMTYAERVDIVNDGVIYRAEAAPGTANSESKWRIRRILISNEGDVVKQWASGNANFDKVWDDRASLEYV